MALNDDDDDDFVTLKTVLSKRMKKFSRWPKRIDKIYYSV